MKYLKITIISILLFLTSCNSNTSSKNFKDIFINNDSIQIKNADSLALVEPRYIFVDNKSRIIWCDFRLPIYFFDFNGNLVKTYNKMGNGPGEITGSPILMQDKSGLYYLFNEVKKNMTILDKNLAYKYSFFIKSPNVVRNITIDKQGDVIIQNNALFGSMKPAIERYSKNGKLLGKWGTIPFIAFSQDALDGPGVVTDLEGNIYYSYLTDYKLYKIDIKDSSLTIFDNKPSYFIAAKENKIHPRAKNVSSTIKYVFTVSRVNKIFFIEPDIIIQQIIQGRYKKTKVFLEIWNTNGKKIYTKVKSPGFIIGSFKNKILFTKQDFNNLKENNTNISIFKYVGN